MLDFKLLSATYQETLLGHIVPFWLKHSRDELCGGFFNALTNDGQPIDADKIVVLQAQQVWAFSYLYAEVQDKVVWLDHARHGARFLAQFAHDDRLHTYALLDRRGNPVSPATDAVPASAVVLAYAQMHRATDEDEWAMLAKQTLTTLLERRAAVRAEQAATLGGFRIVRHLSEPVAVLNALLAMKDLMDEQSWKDAIESVTAELLNEFLDKRLDLLRETVGPEGTFYNTPEGRRLNPGLVFEAAGYLLDLSQHTGNRKLALQAVTWVLRFCEGAWDEIGGGLEQWVDLKDEPCLFPEASHRVASAHLEALAALSKGYFYTHHPDCPKWIRKIHDYTFQFFPDPKYRAWHLALDRAGKPLLPIKATLTTGCFPFIKCLNDTWRMLEKCGQLQPAGRVKTV